MRRSTTCPGVRTLRAHVAGKLDGPQGESLRAHLEECLHCRGIVEGLEATWKDTPPAGEVGWTETELDAANTAPLVDKDLTTSEPVDEQATQVLEASDLAFLERANEAGLLGRVGLYEVRRLLGRGGMGLVFQAFDPTLGRLVALKVMSPRLASSAHARKRFLQEAKAAAAINHSNVVTIHAVGEQGGLPYLVMECVAGETLQQRIRRLPALRMVEIVRIALQVAEGLEAAHRQVVIHRDIKPANIMLEDQVGRVKIADFGLARAALAGQDLSSADQIIGTPEYMSPEQVRGERVDPRSDLFSLGGVIHAMVMGRSPFKGQHALDTLRRVTDLEPTSLRETRPETPAPLVSLVARLLSKDPDARPASAALVADALRKMLADPSLSQDSCDSAPAVDPGAAERRSLRGLVRMPRGRHLLAGAGCLALVLGLAPAVGRWMSPGRGNGPGRALLDQSQASPPSRESGKAAATGEVLTVGRGAGADFRTIEAALVRVTRPDSTIRILDGGTYDGTIEIKDSARLIGLTIEAGSAGERPTLTAPGSRNTILTIKGTPGVTIRGVTLASASDQFALSMGGYIPGVTLRDVRFTKREEPGEQAWSHAWVGEAAHGDADAPFVFEGCAFSPWMNGLVFQGNAGGLISHGVVRGCRFEGRTRQFELIELVRDLRIEHNLFCGGEQALVLDHLQGASANLTIDGNSFWRVREWLSPSGDLASVPGMIVERNALFECPGLDDEAGSLAHLAASGWTFRGNLWESASGPPSPCASMVQRLEVLSRDPASADYLRPAGRSNLMARDGAFAGALAPTGQ